MKYDAEAWEILDNGVPHRHRWSASSLADFQKCPEYYRLTQIERYTRRLVNEHMVFGDAVHRGQEAYYNVEGPPEARLNAALKAGFIAARLLPPDDEKSVKTRKNVARALIAWHDAYGVDTDGWLPLYQEAHPANEVPFSISLGFASPNGTEYHLYGIFDRVVELRGRPAILDSKTTQAAGSTFFFDRYKPDVQMSLYAGAAERLFGSEYRGKVIIDAFFVGRTISRGDEVNVLRGELDVYDGYEAFLDTTQWITLAESFALKNFWPRNRASCSMYGGCMFRGVCSAPERHRATILEQEYSRKDDDATC